MKTLFTERPGNPAAKTPVCPVCYRRRCPLFVQLTTLKFTPAERRKIVVAFHRSVCPRCRCLMGVAYLTAHLRQCNKHRPLKKLSPRQCLPKWWRGK